jgi:simple sugar transport system ATP-binding protein
MEHPWADEVTEKATAAPEQLGVLTPPQWLSRPLRYRQASPLWSDLLPLATVHPKTGGCSCMTEAAEGGGLEQQADAVLTNEKTVISAIGITKTFPGVVANDQVTLRVRRGEVHALLGENGSGKSTLCKILTGLYRPDAGILAVDGRPVAFHSPRHAYDYGVFMVQQHFSLVERLTVAENVVLGMAHAGFRRRGRAARNEAIAAAGKLLHLEVDPSRYIWQLSVGERQRVEILKALYRGARILILDEPTTVLTPQECDQLFVTLRALASRGTAIIFISHKLREVLSVSDRVTVLRKGATVATLDVREQNLSPQHLAYLMVGRDVVLSTRADSASRRTGSPVLSVESVTSENEYGRDVVKDVSFTVGSGEIVGLAGVAGNGQRELAEIITGLRGRTAGLVRVGDRVLKSASPGDAIRAGVAYVPEDRFGTGLVPDLTVADNLILKQFQNREFSRWTVINAEAVASWSDRCITDFDIRGTRRTAVRQLSGGNAQKVLLARELSSGPRALVVASPTRGLDVAATDAVRKLLIKATGAGVGILLISEDLDEVLELADRVLVMFRGAVMGTVDRREADRETIGLMMAGTARDR